MIRRILTTLPKGSLAFIAGSAVYLCLMWVLTGLRTEHWAIILAMNVFFFAGKGTRKFILGFGIFAVFGMLYDVMRAFPNYDFRPVDIGNLYNLEKSLFGINTGGARLTPNEFFAANHNVLGDFLSGFFYINWMPVPLAFALWLYFRNRRLFLNYSLAFLFVNLIGFCVYYIHPAAPPWYVAQYGFDLHLNTPGNTAGLERFDRLIHCGLFHSIYSKNANVFAAMPSLHCAYPVIVLFYSIKAETKWLPYPLAVFMAGIWFSAVYSGHHYMIDDILGILCAVTGILIYEKVLLKTRWYSRFIQNYTGLIS